MPRKKVKPPEIDAETLKIIEAIKNNPKILELLNEGKTIEPEPKKPRGRPKKKLVENKKPDDGILHTIRGANSTNQINRERVVDGKIEGRYTRSEPINVNTKHFDPGIEKNDKANKLLKKYTNPVKPSGKKANRVKVVCSICHKDFLVSPLLAAGEFYKCNGCIIKNAGR